MKKSIKEEKQIKINQFRKCKRSWIKIRSMLDQMICVGLATELHRRFGMSKEEIKNIN